MRRWDQTANDELVLDEGAVRIVPGSGESGWIEIENGIEVQFEPGEYRTGDYWRCAARTSTGTIEWPMDGQQWLPQYPHGVEHHYAPLALVDAVASDPFVEIGSDCRCVFAPLECLPAVVRPRTVETPEKRPAPRGRKKPG